MKKTSFIFWSLLLLAFCQSSFGRGTLPPAGVNNTNTFSTLIIDADVRVVLVNNDELKPTVTGNDKMLQQVSLTGRNDTLFIGAARNRNYKGAGVVYIPATRLRKIAINRPATVSSLNVLFLPQLDVVINADCVFTVSNVGKVNLNGTEAYAVEATTEIRPHPAMVFNRKTAAFEIKQPVY